MTEELEIYLYSSCHFSERLDNDDAVGNGGYGIVITSNGKQIDQLSGGFSFTTNARMDIIGITEKSPATLLFTYQTGMLLTP